LKSQSSAKLELKGRISTGQTYWLNTRLLNDGWRSDLCGFKVGKNPFMGNRLKASECPGNNIPMLADYIYTIINIAAKRSG
jgi:hypothetical protein